MDEVLTPSRRRRPYWILGSFALIVVFPLAAALTYLLFFATPQYSSSFRFVIHGNAASTAASGSGSAAEASSASSAALQAQVFNFMVADFITSPQILSDLDGKVDLRTMFSAPDIDWLSRLSKDATRETLADYWTRRVAIDFDLMAGLTTVTVNAFSPQDAYLLANEVMAISESIVNSIGNRPREDKVIFLEKQVSAAKQKLDQARAEVRKFRAKNSIIDPSAEASMTDGVLERLTQQEVAVTTQLAVLRTELGPDAPAILRLKKQAEAIADEIKRARRRIADSGTEGAAVTYAAQLQDFDDLQLDLKIAVENYQAAEQALLTARKQASEQQYYLLTYVLPTLAERSDRSKAPMRLTIYFLAAMAVWVVTVLVVQSIRDHL